jgi:hypothetical protein
MTSTINSAFTTAAATVHKNFGMPSLAETWCSALLSIVLLHDPALVVSLRQYIANDEQRAELVCCACGLGFVLASWTRGDYFGDDLGFDAYWSEDPTIFWNNCWFVYVMSLPGISGERI